MSFNDGEGGPHPARREVRGGGEEVMGTENGVGPKAFGTLQVGVRMVAVRIF